MDYRVVLSRPSLRDLGRIARYVAQDRPAAAERVGLELVIIAESLSRLPHRGSVFQSRSGVFKLVKDPYLVTYRVDDTTRTVYILRFWHARRSPESWNAE